MLPTRLSLAFLTLLITSTFAEPPEWAGSPDQHIRMKMLLGQMKYDISEFEVEPGAKVKLTLENPDDLQHNLVILNKDPQDKDGFEFSKSVWMMGAKVIETGFVPVGHERILAATNLIDPHASDEIYFIAPDTTGDYPFVCTVPGHSMLMKGQMKVRSNRQMIYDLKYNIYDAKGWTKLPDFTQLTPTATGKIENGVLDLAVSKKKNNIGIVFEGTLKIPKEGEYEFQLASDDGAQLIIDGENEIMNDGIHPDNKVISRKIKLIEGDHGIEVRYFDGGGNTALSLALVSKELGGKVALSKRLSGKSQKKPKAPPTPILLMPEIEGEAVMYRNFIEGTNPRAIAVGYPGGVNVCWDADLMNLAMIWRGGFMDAGRHWTGRGQGNQPPGGYDVVRLPVGFPLQVLNEENEAWKRDHKIETKNDRDKPDPTTVKFYPVPHPDFRFKSYRLDEKRFPTFNYQFLDLTVSDTFTPTKVGGIEAIERTIQFSGSTPANTVFRLSETKPEDLGDGWWSYHEMMKFKFEGAETKERFGKELLAIINGGETLKITYAWKTAVGGKK